MLTPRSHAGPFVALSILVAGCNLAGCDLDGLRLAIQGQRVRDVDIDSAGLTVEVDPPVGISVLVDGERVATTSPYTNRAMAAGPHLLTVRGMGYHGIALPVLLKKHELLRVPVALRPRPPMQWEESKPETFAPLTPPSEPPSAPPPIAELPVGQAPPELHIAALPPAPITLDGNRPEGRAVRITHVRGALRVGSAVLNYNVTPNGYLELSIPDSQGGVWQRDGTPMPRTSFRLTHGLTRLRYIDGTGHAQGLVLRRVN